MLHLFLRDSGLQTASSGEGPRRFVVLYPGRATGFLRKANANAAAAVAMATVGAVDVAADRVVAVAATNPLYCGWNLLLPLSFFLSFPQGTCVTDRAHGGPFSLHGAMRKRVPHVSVPETWVRNISHVTDRQPNALHLRGDLEARGYGSVTLR